MVRKRSPFGPESAIGEASTRAVSTHAGRTELRESQKPIVEFISYEMDESQALVPSNKLMLIMLEWITCETTIWNL